MRASCWKGQGRRKNNYVCLNKHGLQEFTEDRVITADMLADAEAKEGYRPSSMIGVNRRTYKEKKTHAVEDSFMDFAGDFANASKPTPLGALSILVNVLVVCDSFLL